MLGNKLRASAYVTRHTMVEAGTEAEAVVVEFGLVGDGLAGSFSVTLPTPRAGYWQEGRAYPVELDASGFVHFPLA